MHQQKLFTNLFYQREMSKSAVIRRYFVYVRYVREWVCSSMTLSFQPFITKWSDADKEYIFQIFSTFSFIGFFVQLKF